MKKYYALEVNGKEADVYIFGDITSWEWVENDVSSYTLAKELKELDSEVKTINVHINSYGGEVAEGLAIYNTLRGHQAKVKTYCDGFACSAASVVFMAGDERIMSNASLLMIHNAWMLTVGDPKGLRKDADDLEKITRASVNAYMDHINITEEELQKMMDDETWIEPTEALDMGFATTITSESASQKAAASARKSLFQLVKKAKEDIKPEPAPEPEPEPTSESVPLKENKLQKLLTALCR